MRARILGAHTAEDGLIMDPYHGSLDVMGAPQYHGDTNDGSINMTAEKNNQAAVDEALDQFRTMLAADGYLLGWTESQPGKLTVNIEAGEGACADCLVPQPVMEAMMSQALSSTSFELDKVVLPVE